MNGSKHTASFVPLFIASFLCSLCLAVSCHAQEDKRILLLNSYNMNLSWTASVTNGVKAELSALGPSVRLYVEFMDTKNFLEDRYLDLLKQQYRLKYGDVHFDAIITSDDDAARFALKYRDELFNSAPIVFCGVNDMAFPARDDFKNSTGVLELTDIAGTLDSALRLQPNLKNIYIITDQSTTSRIKRKEIQHISKDYGDRLGFIWLDDMSMDEIRKTVSNLPNNSAILLVLFTSDSHGHTFTFTESLVRIYSVANSPIYGMWDFYLGNGIVGGMITSGHVQGEMAVELAAEILNGKKADDIPVILQRSNQYMFDYAVMKQFNINPDLVPDNSLVINMPESIYIKYKFEVWTILCVFALLTGVIIILLINKAARRKAEHELEELTRYQESLIEERTHELVARSSQLEKANYELKKLDTLKTGVLNTVSHDLRTPLTSVLGFCKIIDRDFKKFFLPVCSMNEKLGERGDRIRDNLGIIEDEGGRLIRLINDFLDLSKIESEEMVWNDISLSPALFLEQIRPILQGYFVDSNVSFVLRIKSNLPRIFIDRDRLLQVLTNLVGNAVKFTQEGTVSVIADMTEGRWLRITVEDSGIGIPLEELSNVFEKFYQVNRDSEAVVIDRGSGMGLAISKQIVNHYGGTLKVFSEKGKGSSFILTVPPGR